MNRMRRVSWKELQRAQGNFGGLWLCFPLDCSDGFIGVYMF